MKRSLPGLCCLLFASAITFIGVPAGASSLSPSVAAAIASVPASVFNKVGTTPSVSPPLHVHHQPGLDLGTTKPTVLYMGADYCPYCAAERWALALALSRFGEFSDLGSTSSSPQDIYPSTPSLSFYRSSYTSNYIDFTSVEMYTNKLNKAGNGYQVLQVPTKPELKVQKIYDSPKYFPGVSTTSPPIPFIDIDNRYLLLGSSFSPQLLHGLTDTDIATSLSTPTTQASLDIVATANYIDAAICLADADAPKSVCNSSALKAATKSLGK